jgi:hypothetical protein
MPTTIKGELRRLILQSESDLLAHAELRSLAREPDRCVVADDRQASPLPGRSDKPSQGADGRRARSSIRPSHD